MTGPSNVIQRPVGTGGGWEPEQGQGQNECVKRDAGNLWLLDVMRDAGPAGWMGAAVHRSPPSGVTLVLYLLSLGQKTWDGQVQGA